MKAAIFAFATMVSSAQTPPAPDLMVTMREMADGLGVDCGFCHSAARGSGLPEPKKDIARKMMAMTRDLNATVQSATGKATAEATRVQCITCHRGVTNPGQLSDIMIRTIAEKGADAAASEYRDLRKRYYGRAAYDFGEDTLLGVAQKVQPRNVDNAIAVLKLNIEFNPQSSRSYAAIAYAYTRKLDDATAIAYLEKAVEIDPDNNVARGQLEQLKQYHRKR